MTCAMRWCMGGRRHLGVELRVVEMEGRDGCARADAFKPIPEVRRVSIIKDDLSEAGSRDVSAAISLGHNAIETVRLQF